MPDRDDLSTDNVTPSFSAAARQALLRLARRTIEALVAGDDLGIPALPVEHDLGRPGAAFVTVRVDDELRGCIGVFEARDALWDTVAHLAAAAASRDPRFDALAAHELPRLSIEISVLGPAQPIGRPERLVLGRHGLEVRRGDRRGVLLPQVAIDHDMDREAFLRAVCRKAGLPESAWRDEATELRIFEAEVFSDDPDRRP